MRQDYFVYFHPYSCYSNSDNYVACLVACHLKYEDVLGVNYNGIKNTILLLK